MLHASGLSCASFEYADLNQRLLTLKYTIMPNVVKDLDTAVIEEFTSKIRGEVVLPGDFNYDYTRKVYNAMINKYPGMIVKCIVHFA